MKVGGLADGTVRTSGGFAGGQTAPRGELQCRSAARSREGFDAWQTALSAPQEGLRAGKRPPEGVRRRANGLQGRLRAGPVGV